MLLVKMLNPAFLISIFVYFSAIFVVGFNDSLSFSHRGIIINPKTNLDLTISIIKNDSCPENLPLDCEDVLRSGHNASGVYKVQPWSRAVPNPIEVYCDMETDGGGWTVIQRRADYLRSADYFFKDWHSYKVGFGNVEEDFWLGNDNIFGLTNQKQYSVRFDLRDADENEKYQLYDTFSIDGEENKYMLHIADSSGEAGDSMIERHNGMKFSTKDQQNDKSQRDPCAKTYKGGWWYNTCLSSNLNGMYYKDKGQGKVDGLVWSSWKGFNESLWGTEIKIRRKNFRRLEEEGGV